jgi:long-chain acyl-CoA synthetase
LDSVGKIKIIDRKKNLVKLANGEYVPLEKLEATYKSATLVQQIMVYADSTANKVVAVIVPSEVGMKGLGIADSITEIAGWTTVVEFAQLKKAIMAEFFNIAKESKLPRVQYLADIVIGTEDWYGREG